MYLVDPCSFHTSLRGYFNQLQIILLVSMECIHCIFLVLKNNISIKVISTIRTHITCSSFHRYRIWLVYIPTYSILFDVLWIFLIYCIVQSTTILYIATSNICLRCLIAASMILAALLWLLYLFLQLLVEIS